MDNAHWNDKPLIAFEIENDYSFEKEIRKASGRKELCCPDPECKTPFLRYCHGEKKVAYFAHLNNEHCDYARFDRQNPQIIRNIRRMLYNQFKNKGFQVQIEVKVLEHHYTHLLFDLKDSDKIAVEIGTQQITANKIDTLTAAYFKKGMEVKWIVIDDTTTDVKENQTYFIKRYLFNESKNRDLLVVESNGSEVAQYKVDPNRYEFQGRKINSVNYPETYVERKPIEELSIEGKELTIIGFNNRYEKWLKQKHSSFKKKVTQLEEGQKPYMNVRQKHEKELIEQRLSMKKYQEKSFKSNSNIPSYSDAGISDKNVEINIEYHQSKEKILGLIDQQENHVYYSENIRWLKCEKCGCIETDEKFVSYGGVNHVNLGICYNCNGRKK